MEASRVFGFVKFFGEESHADQFMRGNLYMNRLGYFQRREASETDDGRPDPHEGVVSWHQPDRIELTLQAPGLDPIKIGPADLSGPLSISRNFYADMHLFCMSMLSLPNPALLQGDRDAIEAQLQAAFQIDPRCLSFGPYAVLVDARQFLPQLRIALERCEHWFKADAVQYYDEATFHGDFTAEDAPFRKQSGFAYQKEYRVCLQTPTAGDDPRTLEIGDLSAFAYKLRSADLNSSLRLTLRGKEVQPISLRTVADLRPGAKHPPKA